ncbi:MAG: acyl-ACP--UDP-N-acetylglucosamine O-acyltransferase [Gammaproteobacteria bacterium]|nr:MAG: acyl-ACP--UDP-N-acetylglucosamine O-acyltransferase [Gammaproteobacteria bacterium]
MIHSTAIIHPEAEVAEGVEIGAYTIVGPGVTIGKNTWVGPHAVINGPTIMGERNRIYQFASLGDDPQDKKYKNDRNSRLIIGNGNTIREFCTINRGTDGGGGETSVGDDNWIMAYVHIAHDCHVGNGTVLANNATLAGHVTIGNYAILGGFTGVHQFCRIGAYSLTAIASVVVKDIPPFLIVSGNTARPSGLNREGIRRHNLDQKIAQRLNAAYKTLYRGGLLLTDALNAIREANQDCPEVLAFVRFIDESTRGIVR